MAARVLTGILTLAFVASLLWSAFLWWMAPQGIADAIFVAMPDYKGDGSPKSLAAFIAPLVYRPVSDLILIALVPMTVTALACLSLSVAIGRGWVAATNRPTPADPDTGAGEAAGG